MKHSLVRYLLFAIGISMIAAELAVGLPPTNDVPEEVLRTEVITGARSPIDGQPLTASEYVTVETQLQSSPTRSDQVSQKVRDLIGLVRLRKIIKTVIPFFPIK